MVALSNTRVNGLAAVVVLFYVKWILSSRLCANSLNLSVTKHYNNLPQKAFSKQSPYYAHIMSLRTLDRPNDGSLSWEGPPWTGSTDSSDQGSFFSKKDFSSWFKRVQNCWSTSQDKLDNCLQRDGYVCRNGMSPILVGIISALNLHWESLSRTILFHWQATFASAQSTQVMPLLTPDLAIGLQ